MVSWTSHHLIMAHNVYLISLAIVTCLKCMLAGFFISILVKAIVRLMYGFYVHVLIVGGREEDFVYVCASC